MLLGELRNQSAANHKFHAEREKYWHDSLGSTSAKLQNFTKYVRREDLTEFLARAGLRNAARYPLSQTVRRLADLSDQIT